MKKNNAKKDLLFETLGAFSLTESVQLRTKGGRLTSYMTQDPDGCTTMYTDTPDGPEISHDQAKSS